MFISVSAKKLMRKKSKDNEQTLEELNLAHHHSQAKCQLHVVQTSYIKQIKLFLRSVCTYDLGQDSPIQSSYLVNKS